MVLEAPDYVEPVEGWRVWIVARSGRRLTLRSVFHDAVWEPGVPLTARCEHRTLALRLPWRRRVRHPAPESRCGCGIYAAFRAADVLAYLRLRAPGEQYRAIGRVALWGDVVECESGYRAQHAYPVELFLPEERPGSTWPRSPVRAEDVAEALAGYDVPVAILPAAVEEALLPLAG